MRVEGARSEFYPFIFASILSLSALLLVIFLGPSCPGFWPPSRHPPYLRVSHSVARGCLSCLKPFAQLLIASRIKSTFFSINVKALQDLNFGGWEASSARSLP